MLNDEFQHPWFLSSQESEEGYLPTENAYWSNGWQEDSLGVAFKNMYYDRQFVEFAREMKKHIVNFLERRGN